MRGVGWGRGWGGQPGERFRGGAADWLAQLGLREFKHQQPGGPEASNSHPPAPQERELKINQQIIQTVSASLPPGQLPTALAGLWRRVAWGVGVGVGGRARSSREGRKVWAARGTLLPLRPRCPLLPRRDVRLPSVSLSNSKKNKINTRRALEKSEQELFQ